MKKILILIFAMLLLISCDKDVKEENYYETVIVLSDDEIVTNGTNKESVEIKKDVIYYEDGHDYTYGEGEEKDAHSKEEADLHSVVHITKAGTYRIKGTLSHGQIAVDLGKEAKDDEGAVVTLILDGVDITSTVAPAIIFYNVYECASDEATKDVDTSKAGARVILAQGSVNTVNGSYVARIYKPETVVDGNVENAKKLHKYDGAFYSKMSMTIDGEGTLNINAENAGLDSEMHLTINGGSINIKSGNDGINTNEDGVSVTTINGGALTIEATGETGEGDGIDSNGWLVINGGTVISSACSFSADAGIDSDMGIYVNGGTVIASGHMLDRIEEGGQTFAVFNFSEKQDGSTPIVLKSAEGEEIFSFAPTNAYSVLVYSSPDLKEGTYNLYSGDELLYGSKSEGGRGGMMRPSGFIPSGKGMPEGFTPPEFDLDNMPEIEVHRGDKDFPKNDFPKGERPEGLPEDFNRENIVSPEGEEGEYFYPIGKVPEGTTFLSPDFVIVKGSNYFQSIKNQSENSD